MSFPISITWTGGTPPVAGFQQMAQAAGDLDAALSTSASNMSQFGSTIGQLESPLSSVGSSMGELSGNMQGLDSSLSSSAGAMGDFAGSTEQLNGAVSETGGFITEASGAMGEFGTSATDAGGSATELGTATTDANTGVVELGTGATETGGFITDLGTATGETNTVLTETGTVLSDTAPIMAETATSTGDLAQGFTDLAPPAETSNAVIGDSVSILEGAGTAAEDTALSTEGLGGAFSGLSTEVEPVNGGLTETNTLMGDVGGSATDTSTATGTLNSSMTTLGTGIGAVTGSALTLYSAFTNIRDAQAAVEKAQIKVIDANRKAETAFIKLNGAINKITSDTENHIAGQARLAAAQAKVNQLWDAGIRSGPQFAAALNELRAAQDGLSSSTAKGNEMISKLNPLISGMESTSRKAAGATLGLTRANEGVAESYLGFAGSIVSGVSGLTQIITQAGSVGAKFAPLKGIFTAAGTALSGTVVPALAAIAAPAAAAAAAVGVFVGAVTAIRARMADVDAFGQKIGEVFPAMKGFLDEGRQAFINLSDGVNTAISMVLGGFDSLTGGVLGAQKAWDGWTGKLAKGTGEMGLAGQAANLFALSISRVGERTEVGAGKWANANGVLTRLNGSVLAAKGTWDQLADGTAVYFKTAEKVPPVQQKTADTTEQMSAATKKASDELAGVGTKLEEANAKFAFYGENAKLAELMTNSFALGVAEANVALIDETAKLAEGAGALQAHSQQLASGAIQALAYKQGILEAGEALVKKVQSLYEAVGGYEATNALMQEGTILAVEFAAGIQETKTAIQEETLELTNLAGQLAAYADQMTAANAIANAFTKGMLEQRKAGIDAALGYAEALGKLTELQDQWKKGTSILIAFNTGLIEGKSKAMEFGVGLAQAAGEGMAFESSLRKMAQAAGVDLQSALAMSESQLKDLLGAMALAPDAVNKVINAFDQMGQKIVDSLSKAAQKGTDEFMAEIEKMEQEMGVIFSKEQVQKFRLEADTQTAVSQVQGLLGTLATMVRGQPIDIALKTEAAQATLEQLRQKIASVPAESAGKFAPLQSALDKLATTDFSGAGITKLPGILAQIVAANANLPGGMQTSTTALNGLFAAASQGAGGLEALKSAFAGVGLSLDTMTGKVTNASGQVVAELGKLGPAATGMATEVDSGLLQMSASGDRARDAWARDMQIMFLAVDQFGKHAQTMAITVSGAYSNMAANVNASLNNLAQGIIIIIAAFGRVATTSQSMATTVSGSFSNMASNSIASMNRMAAGFQIIIAAFTRAGTDAQRMNTTVSNAMNQMGSRVSSVASQIQSNMSRISSSMSQAESRARSLASAINALKSKTITITTVYVTRRITRYAAAGGAFVTDSPTSIGPLSVSEFGQRELVTVTPLETPARQPVKGLGDIVGRETEKKTRRAISEEMEKEPSGGGKKEVVMMRELPIIVTVDGREIARVVNKRIFEESDALV